jgi:hypothetical protein
MRRLGLFAGAALLFVALTGAFMVLLRPFAGEPVDETLAQSVAKPKNPGAAHPERSRGTHGEAVRPSTALGRSGSEEAGLEPPKPEPVPAVPAPFRADWKGPRVAILVTDPGEDARVTKAAADALPFEVGFAFPPGHDQALAGRERWLSMPMQPKAYPKVNPGPDTLLVGAAAADNLKKLDAALGKGTPAGVTSMMGSAFTVDAASLVPVMQALKARGLPFIDARATPASVAAAEARKAGVQSATNARFVDAGGSVAANLRTLETEARRTGRAVGFASAAPATTAAIASWAKGLEARGVLLAPPTNIAR